MKGGFEFAASFMIAGEKSGGHDFGCAHRALLVLQKWGSMDFSRITGHNLGYKVIIHNEYPRYS